MLGNPAAGEPCSSAKAGLESTKPLSVLITTTATKPSPNVIVPGTGNDQLGGGAGGGVRAERPLVDRTFRRGDEEVDHRALGEAAALDDEAGAGQHRTGHAGDSWMARQRSRRRHRHGRLWACSRCIRAAWESGSACEYVWCRCGGATRDVGVLREVGVGAGDGRSCGSGFSVGDRRRDETGADWALRTESGSGRRCSRDHRRVRGYLGHRR